MSKAKKDKSGFRIAVLGAGLSGMCMGIKLLENGFSNFTIFEKADAVGGTWRENTYPGVSCDVPSHLYSYSFARNPDWNKTYSGGAEIQAYCEKIARDYGILPHCKFGSQVTSATRKNDAWQLEFSNGEKGEFDFVVTAIGGLHTPSFANIAGRDNFKGDSFHSAQWQHDVDLKGKRVGVIGSAASAVQLVPQIADDVKDLTIFQRTPNWLLERDNRVISERSKRRMRRFPILSWLRRARIFLYSDFIFHHAFKKIGIMQHLIRRQSENYITETVADEELRNKLIPDFPLGCKRVLFVEGYLEALQKPNVTLEVGTIAQVTKTGVVDNKGVAHEFDVLIYATGFEPFNFVDNMKVSNAKGLTLNDAWDDKISAHRTISVSGFPNLFMLLGPNSGLGHNSIILMIEAQVRYIIDGLRTMDAKGLKHLAPKQNNQEAFFADMQEGLKGTVWNANCSSWYKNGTHGATPDNHTLWPYSTWRYMREMKHMKISEYEHDENI